MKNPRRSNSALARLLTAGGIVCATLCGAAPAPKDSPPPTVAAQHLSHGRFKNVAVYAPSGTPTSFVLFLSGDGGWNPGMAAIARQLSSHGAMVAGIDLPRFRADLEADDADCVFPDGDLENLSHFVQAYYHLPTYLTPFFVGFGAGAEPRVRDARSGTVQHLCRCAHGGILPGLEHAQAALQGFGS